MCVWVCVSVCCLCACVCVCVCVYECVCVSIIYLLYIYIYITSTVTNLLISDAHIAELASTGHPINVILFDFTKAFDKAPHRAVINALAERGVCGTALR